MVPTLPTMQQMEQLEMEQLKKDAMWTHAIRQAANSYRLHF